MDDLESRQPPAPQPAADGWELACEGILRTEFGRRPSMALDRAMTQLAAEEAHASGTFLGRCRESILECAGVLRSRPVFAGGAAILAIIGVSCWLGWNFYNPGNKTSAGSVSVCKLTKTLDVRWSAGSREPRSGALLPEGPLQLEAGVIELTFPGGAQVAVEGPARIRLKDPRSLQLLSGKLAADVARPARGFAVSTPTATVVDLGTRFGVNVTGKNSSRVDVFEGRVQVLHNPSAGNARWNLRQKMAMTVSSSGAARVKPWPESKYPQPERLVYVRPENCGFDALKSAVLGGVPIRAGFWSGPSYQLSGSTEEVSPAEGEGMLRFLAPPSGLAGASATGADSKVWQIINLHSAKEMMAAGPVELTAFAKFNRTRGTSQSSKKFGFTVAAFQGSPQNAGSLWASRNSTALAIADRELTADDNPATWEKEQVGFDLPPQADFLIVQLRAIAPSDPAPGADIFPGNFADLVDVCLHAPMRPSLETLIP